MFNKKKAFWSVPLAFLLAFQLSLTFLAGYAEAVEPQTETTTVETATGETAPSTVAGVDSVTAESINADSAVQAEQVDEAEETESAPTTTAEAASAEVAPEPVVPDTEETTAADPSVGPVRSEAPVGAPAKSNEVTLVGQWVADSSKKVDTKRAYTSLDDPIGKPEANSGLLRGLAKTFLGWSTKPAVENGKLAEGARLYSPYDRIGLAFGDSIPQDAKLYGVYFSLNKPVDEGLPGDTLSLLALAGFGQQIKDLINDNSINLNPSISREDTLPNTKNDGASEGPIIDYYEEKDDASTVHEVALEAELKMNDVAAMLAYKNPIGSNQLLPIFSRNYKEKYENDSFSTATGEDAGYTYVDLTVTLDEGMKLPSGKLYMQFDSYSWRPLFLLDANRKRLNISDPRTGKDLGKTSGAFSSLISNTSRQTPFAVDLTDANLLNADGKQQVTLRVVLRNGDGEKITEDGISPSNGKTIAETILENMKLRILRSDDIKLLNPNLGDLEVNQSVVRIPNDEARRLALSNGQKKLGATGYIDGSMTADAGSVSLSWLSMNLRSTVEISKKTPEHDLNVAYKMCELIFDANGGVFADGTALKTFEEPKGSSFTIIEAPKREGYKFLYWKGSEYQPGDEYQVTEPSHTFTAVWVPMCELVFDANGGAFADGTALKTFEEAKGNSFTIIEAPKREGYKFLYWKGSEYQPGDEYQVTEPSHTFTAVWTPEPEKTTSSETTATTKPTALPQKTTSSETTATTKPTALPRTGEQIKFPLPLIVGSAAATLLLLKRKNSKVD